MVTAGPRSIGPGPVETGLGSTTAAAFITCLHLVRLSAVASYVCFTERETESVVDCKYIRPDIRAEELSIDLLPQSTRTTTVLLAVNLLISTVSIAISPKILVATSLCFREASIEQSG